jgi:hypothetical protein
MNFEYKILENGDLEISTTPEEGETLDKWRERFEKDFSNTLAEAEEMFNESFFPNTEFRIIDDHEKIALGHLYSGDIITSMDYYSNDIKGEDYSKMTPEEITKGWNDNSWHYPDYAIVDPLSVLFTTGKVVWKVIGKKAKE